MAGDLNPNQSSWFLCSVFTQWEANTSSKRYAVVPQHQSLVFLSPGSTVLPSPLISNLLHARSAVDSFHSSSTWRVCRTVGCASSRTHTVYAPRQLYSIRGPCSLRSHITGAACLCVLISVNICFPLHFPTVGCDRATLLGWWKCS